MKEWLTKNRTLVEVFIPLVLAIFVANERSKQILTSTNEVEANTSEMLVLLRTQQDMMMEIVSSDYKTLDIDNTMEVLCQN